MKNTTLVLLCILMMSMVSMVDAQMRPMIMLFDWKYEKPGSGFKVITEDLVFAVTQKAAPILVSGSLWRNALEQNFIPDLKSTEWIMKKLTSSGSLYLLVPKNNPDAQKGLKLNDFPNVPDMRAIQQFPAAGINNLDTELLPAIKKLFVTKDLSIDHEWLFYLGGHGEQNSDLIAGLQEKTFKELLAFFNDTIITKFVFYMTCRSGGERLVRPYETTYVFPKGVSETRADVFNYTIVSAMTFYLTAFSLPGTTTDFKKGFAALQVYFDDPTQAMTMSTILQYLHPTLVTALQGGYIDQRLDAFLGNKNDLIYKVPLYASSDGVSYVKLGNDIVLLISHMYCHNGEVFIDPRKGYPARTNGDSCSLTPEQIQKGQAATLVLEKDTGFVFKIKNQYLAMWDDPKTFFDRIQYLQVPAIRFPGTEWFSVADVDNKVQRISRIEALTAQADNKPIVAAAKQIVIFDTQSPFIHGLKDEHAAFGTFEIKPKKPVALMPQIMLMAPANALLYFEKIEADGTLMNLLRAFMPVQEYRYARTFYSKKVICNNDLTPQDATMIGAQPGVRLELDDVIILSNATYPPFKDNKRYNGVLFTYNGKKFSAVWPASDGTSYKTVEEKKGLPFLKSAEYTFDYPYKQDLTEYKGIAAVKTALEKKLKQLEQPTGQPQPVTPPQPQNVLAQKLQELATALHKLRNALAVQ